MSGRFFPVFFYDFYGIRPGQVFNLFQDNFCEKMKKGPNFIFLHVVIVHFLTPFTIEISFSSFLAPLSNISSPDMWVVISGLSILFH